MVSLARSAVVLVAATLLAAPMSAQSAPPTAKPATLTSADLKALAQAQVDIAAVLDSSGAQLAQVKNKTLQAQEEMREKRRELVAKALSKHGLTAEEFERRRFLVSTDGRMRFQLDSMVANLTGQPLPGTYIPAGPAAAPAAPPGPALPGMVGIAVGYVSTRYLDTPDNAGLLAMAMTEAKIAAQHAGFMARTPENLATMQMHAGHVLHAIDPSTMPAAKAPGKGYGVKRALASAIDYTDLAAKNPGASANVKTHAAHIIGAAQSSLQRSDEVIALARKIQSAKDAATAAALVGQLQSLCDQLAAGVDVNADGRITWNGGEGGIQQAQEHVNLLVAGEKK